MSDVYRIPSETVRTETVVKNSRFIATVGKAETAEDAKTFLRTVQAEMPDASHHVYAFRAGYGNSVTEGMSDDGEPSGTAGPPVLSILRGTDIGDIIVVVTRYFGGTKLGTGGLVRAYGDAAREGLKLLKTHLKIPTVTYRFQLPYPHYESAKRLIVSCEGEIHSEDFLAEIEMEIVLPQSQAELFRRELRDMTSGGIDLD